MSGGAEAWHSACGWQVGNRESTSVNIPICALAMIGQNALAVGSSSIHLANQMAAYSPYSIPQLSRAISAVIDISILTLVLLHEN